MAKKKTQAPKNHYLTWRRSLGGGLVFATIYAVLSYIFVSLAIDNGSLWQYLLALASLGLGIHSAAFAIKQKVHESK